jgi:transketolase
MGTKNIAALAVNTIRTLSIDAVQKANSGHPGLPLGCAPMAYVLWHKHLKHDPTTPKWFDRDRFILSAGHGSMLIYSLLHLAGYDLPLSELANFRQWESRTPGHPESFMTEGVEATTGPLGQGSANAVGFAMAERHLAHTFNRPGHEIIDHFTFALVSDGDLMEGVSTEAASLAGHLKLGKLIYLYDANDVTLDGPASMHFTEDVCARYESYGWQVLRVENGDSDLDAIDKAIAAAKSDTSRPTLIWIHTTIGFGSPNKAGSCDAHGSPLGAEEVALTKKALGWDPEKTLYVPDEVRAHWDEAKARGGDARAEWEGRLEAYRRELPELAAELDRRIAGELPAGWDAGLPSFEAGTKIATRAAAGKVLNAIAAKVPEILGGDADLSGSTKTTIADGSSFEGVEGSGRNIHFGVREHAMGSICNGIDGHGGVRTFGATFFCFSDYMRPAVRIASLNGQPVVYVWTHDSIGLGEDGPTHQPVEHLMSLRAMINLHVVRPGDGNEARAAWVYAMRRTDGPTALVLSRQNLLVVDRDGKASADELHKGAYVLDGDDDPQVILMATGSELEIAVAARELLTADAIRSRVVSMPCWEAFAAQDASYRDQVLPPSVTARVSIEAGVTFGWSRWVGDKGVSIGVDEYGASAPAEKIYQELGLTAKAVADAAKAQI